MSLTYSTYTSQIANLMVISTADPNFQTMLPGMIDYAEQRIYREIDLLYTQLTYNSSPMTIGSRTFRLPSFPTPLGGPFIVIDQVSVITPSSTATPATGTRASVVFTSREFIDITQPSNAPGVPQFYSMSDDSALLFGPPPDKAYSLEIVGTFRPEPLGSSNGSTILTEYVPDLFVAASMVFASGYMRDFGAQADNPQMGAAWENQYKLLFQSAQTEQLRAKHQGEGWTSDSPSPIATPKRV